MSGGKESEHKTFGTMSAEGTTTKREVKATASNTNTKSVGATNAVSVAAASSITPPSHLAASVGSAASSAGGSGTGSQLSGKRTKVSTLPLPLAARTMAAVQQPTAPTTPPLRPATATVSQTAPPLLSVRLPAGAVASTTAAMAAVAINSPKNSKTAASSSIANIPGGPSPFCATPALPTSDTSTPCATPRATPPAPIASASSSVASTPTAGACPSPDSHQMTAIALPHQMPHMPMNYNINPNELSNGSGNYCRNGRGRGRGRGGGNRNGASRRQLDYIATAPSVNYSHPKNQYPPPFLYQPTHRIVPATEGHTASDSGIQSPTRRRSVTDTACAPPHTTSAASVGSTVDTESTSETGDGDLAQTATPHHREPRERDQFIRDNYKTEICRTHLASGYCEYESNCQFAHGVEELRPRHFGVKYKTQLCKNYHDDGHCRFGSRCKFIHDEHRVQVSDNEFWLVSPQENLVRVEVVDNPIRKSELQNLVNQNNASALPPPPSQQIQSSENAKAKIVPPPAPGTQVVATGLFVDANGLISNSPALQTPNDNATAQQAGSEAATTKAATPADSTSPQPVASTGAAAGTTLAPLTSTPLSLLPHVAGSMPFPPYGAPLPPPYLQPPPPQPMMYFPAPPPALNGCPPYGAGNGNGGPVYFYTPPNNDGNGGPNSNRMPMPLVYYVNTPNGGNGSGAGGGAGSSY